MEKLVKDGNKIAGEEVSGLMAAEIKRKLFYGVGAQPQDNGEMQA